MEKAQKEMDMSAPEEILKAALPKPTEQQPEILLQDDHSFDLSVNGL